MTWNKIKSSWIPQKCWGMVSCATASTHTYVVVTGRPRWRSWHHPRCHDNCRAHTSATPAPGPSSLPLPLLCRQSLALRETSAVIRQVNHRKHLQNLGWLGASGRWEVQWEELSRVTLPRLWKSWPSQAEEKTHTSSSFCLIIWRSRLVLGPPRTEGGRTVSHTWGRFSCPAPQQIPGVTNDRR